MNSIINTKLKLGLALNTAFTIFEFIVGTSVGSLALMADAAHNLTDSLTLLISWAGNKIAGKKADADHTYGHGRAGILTALLNACILIALAIVVFFEAYGRFMHPTPVAGGWVAIVAGVGIVINGSITWMFRSERRDLNVRSAYINMFLDTLASLGALVAGLLILQTGRTFFDPLMSLIIGIMLVLTAGQIVREALSILSEGVPLNMNVDKVSAAIRQQHGVRAMDDLHIWTITPEQIILSCHITVDDCHVKRAAEITSVIKHMLKHTFNISHSTIEVELKACDPM